MYIDATKSLARTRSSLWSLDQPATARKRELNVLPQISCIGDDTAAAASGADYKNDLYPLTDTHKPTQTPQHCSYGCG